MFKIILKSAIITIILFVLLQLVGYWIISNAFAGQEVLFSDLFLKLFVSSHLFKFFGIAPQGYALVTYIVIFIVISVIFFLSSRNKTRE